MMLSLFIDIPSKERIYNGKFFYDTNGFKIYMYIQIVEIYKNYT